ncbi:MAG: hypothetical protein HY722_00530 [Planctomycetes bacterium]|nr:hypothetical protein [Planctomycetota bacterium]
MKIAGVLVADLGLGALGLASRLLEDLAGRPVLRRSAEAMLRSRRLDAAYVACRRGEADRVRQVLDGLPVEVLEVGEPPPVRERLRRGRRWAAASWRGGLAGSTAYDEEAHPGALRAALERAGAGAVARFPSAGPYVDSAMVDGLLEEFAGLKEPIAFFPPAAPGLAAEVYGRELVEALDRTRLTPASVLRLDLDRPDQDPERLGMVPQLATEVMAVNVRLTCDSARGLALCREVARTLGEGSFGTPAADLARLLEGRPELRAGEVPRELSVEPTTREAPGASGEDLDPEGFEAMVRGATALTDDLLVSLEGRGDPLAAPLLAGLVARARAAGAWGVHVATHGAWLGEESSAALVEAGLDVLSVRLDASTPETYRAVHGEDRYDRVLANLHGFARSAGGGGPFLVPVFTKRRDNLHELAGFFEDWYRAEGQAVVRGYETSASTAGDLSAVTLTLPGRGVCEHVLQRMVVRADGSVPYCLRDTEGRRIVGNALVTPVPRLWRGAALEAQRAAHARGDWARELESCGPCTAWGQV